MSEKNTAEQWSRVWRESSGMLKEQIFSVERIQRGFTWALIRQWLGDKSVMDLDTIEIGAGAGTVSAVLARHGAAVTVLDYATEAHKVSDALFEKLGLPHESVLGDALNLSAELHNRFDIAMSYGLAEHFEGANRSRIVKAHFDLVKPGGLIVLSVPNRHCWPYRIWKGIRELRGKWHYGLEIPFSRAELISICQSLGVSEFRVTGSSFLESFNFILPFARWKRSLEKRLLGDRRFDPSRIPQERETSLGPYLGMALLLIARKPETPPRTSHSV